ncbi:MAG: alpha/beta fold hydrolase [Gammaproteobacteria bacterium]|nr:alpha/beta fold hydrolase [Gammaproteobacteria bacterium]
MISIPPDVLAIALRVVLVGGGIYLAFCLLLWALQERMIFHPRPLTYPPFHPAADPVEIRNAGETLRGWIVNERSTGPLVVYFGGNAEEVSGNIPRWADFQATTVLVNYRGFGQSTGTPSERNLVADARAIVHWARQRHPDKPLVLFGMSLGSGVAALAAADTSPDALVIISPYRSVEHIARSRFPIFPIRWLLRHPFDAESVAASMPRTLAFASPSDLVIPFSESAAMVQSLGDRVEFHQYDLGHNAFLEHAPLWDEVREFLYPYTTRQRTHDDRRQPSQSSSVP